MEVLIMASVIIRFSHQHEHPTTLMVDNGPHAALAVIQHIAERGKVSHGDVITVEELSDLPEFSRSSQYSG
jgi:hypothetical protein